MPDTTPDPTPDTTRYVTPRFADHDPTDPNHPANSAPGGDPDVHTAYWAFNIGADGLVVWMWNCEACPAVGTCGGADGEADAIRAMNDHAAQVHPDATYVPTAVPT